MKPGETGELIVDASADTFFSEYLTVPTPLPKSCVTAGISLAMFASYVMMVTWILSDASMT